MDAKDVIDSYVHDVARQLPRGKRNDVAFELHALLTDELRGRAEAEGRLPDAEMAVAMVREFGRPAQTAVRYYQPFTIVEPSDTWSFLVATVAGGTLVALLASGARPDIPELGNLAFLGWLGTLVVLFALKNLILRRRPDAFAWKPRLVRVSDSASRVAAVGLALLWSALLVLYLRPGQTVETLSGGRVAAETLAYSDSFSGALRMPWLVALLALLVALQLVVAVQGRWRPATRWTRIVLHLEISLQLGWHARYGSIFEDPRTDQHLITAFAVASALILVVCGIEAHREYTRVRPAPATPSGLTA